MLYYQWMKPKYKKVSKDQKRKEWTKRYDTLNILIHFIRILYTILLLIIFFVDYWSHANDKKKRTKYDHYGIEEKNTYQKLK